MQKLAIGAAMALAMVIAGTAPGQEKARDEAAKPAATASAKTQPQSEVPVAPPEVFGKVAPGQVVRVQFSGMPTAWSDIETKRDAKPQMTIFLPTNYDPARKHPLLIFLYGGWGGSVNNPDVARALAEDKDFVCASLPLFKDKSTGSIIIQGADGKLGWPHYKTMLDQLEKLVPNLDPQHRVLGGFSNGAHATASLLDQSDGEIARRFSAFFFVEGGGKLVHYDLLKDKRFLMAYGSEGSRSRAQQVYEAAQAAGAKSSIYDMNSVGHAFPAAKYPEVRKWLRGPALE